MRRKKKEDNYVNIYISQPTNSVVVVVVVVVVCVCVFTE